MSLRTRVAGGLRAWFRSRQAEQDLDAELREFLESAIDANMAAGMSREAATRAARVSLGSVEAVKDRVRDVGWESVADSVCRDVRYALRTLAQIARLYRRHDSHPRARHRRQHRHLQPDRCPDAAHAAGP